MAALNQTTISTEELNSLEAMVMGIVTYDVDWSAGGGARLSGLANLMGLATSIVKEAARRRTTQERALHKACLKERRAAEKDERALQKLLADREIAEEKIAAAQERQDKRARACYGESVSFNH